MYSISSGRYSTEIPRDHARRRTPWCSGRKWHFENDEVTMNSHVLELFLITLSAAIVNGALGYGFSSITVPLALLFLTNRVLNPALVLIEVPLNAWVLWVNRDALSGVWRRVLPIVIGLAPGVAVGTVIVAQVSPGWLKLATYVILLPLILFQAAGFRR